MKRVVAIFIVMILFLTAVLLSTGRRPVNTATDASPDNTVKAPEIQTVRITFPEGYTLIDIAEKLESNSVCSAADFMALTTDREYLASLDYDILDGIENVENVAYYLEGFVFPDTYDFYIGESAGRALSRFLENADSRITDEHIARAAELGYSIREIITIASVIQKEASDPLYMSDVSSVIHNRLDSPSYGKLQCDVTIHYVNNCITDSPYLEGDTSAYAEHFNTYKCDGLPAGPICNPGLSAIEAALYPTDTNYFFFVTDSDWNYYFAETYDEHVENCRAVGIYN